MTTEPKEKETHTIEISNDANLVRHPFGALQDAINSRRWFEGIVMSSVYIERFGVERIEEYLKQKGVPTEPIVDRLPMWKIIRLLKAFEIVEDPISSLMSQVKDERNTIVHKVREPDAIDGVKAKATIENAIECLRALGVSE